MLSHRSARIVVVAILVLGTLALPAHDRGDRPPESATSQRHVSDWGAPTGEGWRLSATIDERDLVLVGGRWTSDERVQVRARSDDGWGPWQELERHGDHGSSAAGGHDHAAAHGEHEGPVEDDLPDRSEPVWTGRTDAVQLRSDGAPEVELTTVTMSGPDGLAYSPTVTSGSAAYADAPQRIVSRSEWDPAGDCRPNAEPEYTEDVRVGVVHHTHIFPRYSLEEADDLIRAVCLYHVGDRGFDDLGYNVLVDHFGTVYEGRLGGLDRGVVGSHAAGFNHSSFGVAVLGDFEDHDVPQPAVDALDRVLAWKFSVHGIDPRATRPVTSTGGALPGLTPYPAGAVVDLPAIIGHRDTSSDSLCPGRFLYARLAGASDRVAGLMAEGVRMQVGPESGTTTSTSDGGVIAGEPTGPASGSIGLMAAPAPLHDLPNTGGTSAALLGGAALGLAGLAVGGRRRG